MTQFVTRIAGVGSYVPENIFKNQDLEKMMDTSDEWIRQRTGIEERRWVDDDWATSDLALRASENALKQAGVDKKDLDMIIFATLSPDHDFPGSACFLQAKLDIPNIAALDIRQQCSGFIYGLSIADQFIKTGDKKKILLVGAELHSKGLDKTPAGRDVSVLFGDGAGAVVLEAVDASGDSDQAQIYHSAIHANGAHAKELWLPAPGMAFTKERINAEIMAEGLHFPKMNGKTVFVHAVKNMAETLSSTLKKTQIPLEKVDLFLFHQANLRINQKVAEMMKIPEDKVFNTIQRFGNTTAATIPLGMDEAIKAGKLERGMTVAMAAFGSGFTWASSVLKY